MRRKTKELQRYTIQATDGEIGTTDQFLFDDETWTIRYLVVKMGNWLTGRQHALISPIAIHQVDDTEQQISVNLNRQQVKESPDIDTDQPVSRQQELELFRYYNYPSYWGGPGIWGGGMYPSYPGSITNLAEPLRSDADMDIAQQPLQTSESQGDPHLRSTREVAGYVIQAQDGEIGHISDFIMSDDTWSLRYIEVDTRNWWPGKHVLVAPRWIEAIDWAIKTVNVNLLREAIKQAPEYDPSQPVTRDYEEALHQHYQRAASWEEEPHANA